MPTLNSLVDFLIETTGLKPKFVDIPAPEVNVYITVDFGEDNEAKKAATKLSEVLEKWKEINNLRGAVDLDAESGIVKFPNTWVPYSSKITKKAIEEKIENLSNIKDVKVTFSPEKVELVFPQGNDILLNNFVTRLRTDGVDIERTKDTCRFSYQYLTAIRKRGANKYDLNDKAVIDIVKDVTGITPKTANIPFVNKPVVLSFDSSDEAKKAHERLLEVYGGLKFDLGIWPWSNQITFSKRNLTLLAESSTEENVSKDELITIIKVLTSIEPSQVSFSEQGDATIRFFGYGAFEAAKKKLENANLDFSVIPVEQQKNSIKIPKHKLGQYTLKYATTPKRIEEKQPPQVIKQNPIKEEKKGKIASAATRLEGLIRCLLKDLLEKPDMLEISSEDVITISFSSSEKMNRASFHLIRAIFKEYPQTLLQNKSSNKISINLSKFPEHLILEEINDDIVAPSSISEVELSMAEILDFLKKYSSLKQNRLHIFKIPEQEKEQALKIITDIRVFKLWGDPSIQQFLCLEKVRDGYECKLSDEQYKNLKSSSVFLKTYPSNPNSNSASILSDKIKFLKLLDTESGLTEEQIKNRREQFETTNKNNKDNNRGSWGMYLVPDSPQIYKLANWAMKKFKFRYEEALLETTKTDTYHTETCKRRYDPLRGLGRLRFGYKNSVTFNLDDSGNRLNKPINASCLMLCAPNLKSNADHHELYGQDINSFREAILQTIYYAFHIAQENDNSHIFFPFIGSNYFVGNVSEEKKIERRKIIAEAFSEVMTYFAEKYPNDLKIKEVVFCIPSASGRDIFDDVLTKLPEKSPIKATLTNAGLIGAIDAALQNETQNSDKKILVVNAGHDINFGGHAASVAQNGERGLVEESLYNAGSLAADFSGSPAKQLTLPSSFNFLFEHWKGADQKNQETQNSESASSKRQTMEYPAEMTLKEHLIALRFHLLNKEQGTGRANNISSVPIISGSETDALRTLLILAAESLKSSNISLLFTSNKKFETPIWEVATKYIASNDQAFKAILPEGDTVESRLRDFVLHGPKEQKTVMMQSKLQ